MITCPCNVYPLTPHFYIVKLEVTGVYIFFHIFALKHRLWVLVRIASLKNITIFHLKIIVFIAVKKCSILHGRVFVMIA